MSTRRLIVAALSRTVRPCHIQRPSSSAVLHHRLRRVLRSAGPERNHPRRRSDHRDALPRVKRRFDELHPLGMDVFAHSLACCANLHVCRSRWSTCLRRSPYRHAGEDVPFAASSARASPSWRSTTLRSHARHGCRISPPTWICRCDAGPARGRRRASFMVRMTGILEQDRYDTLGTLATRLRESPKTTAGRPLESSPAHCIVCACPTHARLRRRKTIKPGSASCCDRSDAPLL